MKSHYKEITKGKRFEFGKNWLRFLCVIDEERIILAEKSLQDMLSQPSLNRKEFLDIGSGSGLFSLAARRLGAKVFSFDYDPQSVACTSELKRRYFPGDPHWKIEEGSVLDLDYMKSTGKFDIVYSWGVLHHTGDMWKALDYAHIPVKSDGLLFIAIYNDEGKRSVRWQKIKKLYCSNTFMKLILLSSFITYFSTFNLIKDAIFLRNPIKRYANHKKSRGMSIIYDWIDWLGGYPFEFAKPEEIFEFYTERGFNLIKMKTVNHLGNNQFVFKRD